MHLSGENCEPDDWVTSTPYLEGAQVTENFVQYEALKDHTSSGGSQPPDTEFWAVRDVPLICSTIDLKLIDISLLPGPDGELDTGDEPFYFLRVSRISDTFPGPDGLLGTGDDVISSSPGGYFAEFGGPTPDGPDGVPGTADDGESEFILLTEEEEGVGGFYNFYWDTDDSLGPDGTPGTGDERNLPGKGTYAVDIMLAELVSAIGIVTLDSGASGSVDSITVDGVEVMTGGLRLSFRKFRLS